MSVSQRLIHAHFQRAFAAQDLSVSQLHLLKIIMENQPVNFKSLAGKMYMTPGAITQLVDALDARGYIIRSPDERDRRITNISISDSAYQKMEGFKKAREQIFHDATAALDVGELQTLLTVHQKMLAYFEAQNNKERMKKEEK